jgi:hypothetical protein
MPQACATITFLSQSQLRDLPVRTLCRCTYAFGIVFQRDWTRNKTPCSMVWHDAEVSSVDIHARCFWN